MQRRKKDAQMIDKGVRMDRKLMLNDGGISDCTAHSPDETRQVFPIIATLGYFLHRRFTTLVCIGRVPGSGYFRTESRSLQCL
jgi:hypothetical protein